MGVIQIKTHIDSNTQKQLFDSPDYSLTRYPDANGQNKSNWCWAASAKIVAEHNGEGLNPEIDTKPQMLINTAGLHKTYYGYVALKGITRYFADGVQYAIVKKFHNNDENKTGNAHDTRDALQYISKNAMSVGWQNNDAQMLTSEMIAQLNDDLENGKYVAGRVATLDNKLGHLIVIKSRNDDGTYTVFNPWNKEEMNISAKSLLEIGNYKYLDNTYGIINAFYYCR